MGMSHVKEFSKERKEYVTGKLSENFSFWSWFPCCYFSRNGFL